MKHFDPFTISGELKERYIQYLLDSHVIHDSEDELRSQFEQALRRRDQFVREPLVSIIPAYEHGVAPEELLGRQEVPRLDDRLRSLSSAFEPSRPLYTHQLQAIEHIQHGHNAAIATGTGSGKTECFLLPILDEVIRSKDDGVHAILIYPMNALANDQLERLRVLVGDSGVTFGRYTGQTPWTEDEVPTRMLEKAKRPNERLTREEIRSDPPKILLTNFAMLEYLLLRPQDQDIFRHQSVRLVVLDEAHTYSGAQGIDIGLLMRRFQRLFPERLQYVLTSATLGDPTEPDAKRRISEFASDLCGSSFSEQDVIFGQTTTPFPEGRLASLSESAISGLSEHGSTDCIVEALEAKESTASWLSDCGLNASSGKDPREVLYNTLTALEPARMLYQLLEESPASVEELATRIFGDSEDGHMVAVRSLLTMASMAKPSFEHASPLMSVRVHHFFRGLVGASVELTQAKGRTRVERVHLEDREVSEAPGGHVLPLRTCVHCGLPVLVVDVENGKWRKPSRTSSNIRLLTWIDAREFESQSDQADDAAVTPDRSAYLCLESRLFVEDEEPESDAEFLRLFVIETTSREGHLKRCPNCGAMAAPFDSVLREFRTGEDAPTALLAEELVRAVPAENPNRPAGGRRLLAFSDSRQRAAYFTPYLMQTTCQPAYVQPLVEATKVLETSGWEEPPTADEVIKKARELVLTKPWVALRDTDEDGFDRYVLMHSRQLNPSEKKALAAELAVTLYQHLAASPAQRSRLFGLMLLGRSVQLEQDELEGAAKHAPALFSDGSIANDAVCRLLLYLVRRRAVAFWPDTVNAASLMRGEVGPTLVTVHRNATNAMIDGRQRFRWNPFEAPPKHLKQAVQRSRTARIVRRALSAYGEVTDEDVQQTLNGLWEWLIEDERILRSCHPGEYRLPASRILVLSNPRWYRCLKCGAPTVHRMDGTCELFGCDGQLEPVEPGKNDCRNRHLAYRYSRVALPLNVKEHTAQLTFQRGREYQDGFLEGEVNVLSSSTTFEMGVDVGSLQAVLLRNVPPTAANYIQRAGRAGRRRDGGVAHAVTYARAIPHDQHHYFSPVDIVAGHVPVPVIYTANIRLTQRHINSFLLGRFLFDLRDEIGHDSPKISEFFPEDLAEPESIADKFGPWCRARRDSLLPIIRKIIPDDCHLEAIEAMETAARTLFARDADAVRNTAYYRGQLQPLQSYEQQAADLQAEIEEAMASKNRKKASGLLHAIQHVEKLRSQLLDTRLIDFLSATHWLPSYAFPQDNVRLLVRTAEEAGNMRLERDRERGISEYAPGAEVIADGKLFVSAGINLEHSEPELKWFSTNGGTRRICIGNTPQEAEVAEGSNPIRFIEPLGFTTKWDDEVKPPNLFRLRPPSNTEVFLQDGVPDEQFEECSDVPGVLTGIRPDGKLFRANLGGFGNGFLICLRCGLRMDPREGFPAEHKAPWGATCRGKFQKIALAHVFITDVMQVRFPGHGFPHISDTAFWLTLTTAFRNTACQLLHIDSDDLDATYRGCREDGPEGEIVLYDRVPGGAGHVERIRAEMAAILKGTRTLLADCPNPECDLESSCYACLRSHRNQFYWHNLRRNAPLPLLGKLCPQPGTSSHTS